MNESAPVTAAVDARTRATLDADAAQLKALGYHNMIVATSRPVENDPTPHQRFVDGYWATLQRFTDGVYVNTMNDEPPDFVEANNQGNLQRLRRLKRKYDPTNLFRLNANVRPSL